MKIEAVCEYNDLGYLIYAANYPGAFVRGTSENEALAKFPGEVRSYLRWRGETTPGFDAPEIETVQRKLSDLQICDADSDVLFDLERQPMTQAEYEAQKLLVLKSAEDFEALYRSIPNPDISGRPPRRTFYGAVPRTPRQMYEHVNQTTSYYAAAMGVELENLPDLYANRMQVLAEIEQPEDFLEGPVHIAPDGESWTLRKLLRRFLWHDRIHARAMWRTATALWGDSIANPFYFV